MTTLAEKIALILSAPVGYRAEADDVDNLTAALVADGYGPAERSNICARLTEAAPFTTTYEDWVIQAKLAVERA